MIIKCPICKDGSYDSEIYKFYHKHNHDKLCRECFRKEFLGEIKIGYGFEAFIPINNRFEILDIRD